MKRRIHIFGTGCDQSRQIARIVEAAARDLELDCEIQSVTDADVIAQAGVLSPPALAIDGQVRAIGHVPTLEAVKQLLS